MTKTIKRSKAVDMFLAVAIAELTNADAWTDFVNEEERNLVIQGIKEIRNQAKGIENGC